MVDGETTVEGPIVIRFDPTSPVRVSTAGGVVEIKQGRSKNFFVRKDGRLHLLDCSCEVCLELRASADAPA